jgi:hypothetical protein
MFFGVLNKKFAYRPKKRKNKGPSRNQHANKNLTNPQLNILALLDPGEKHPNNNNKNIPGIFGNNLYMIRHIQ